MDLAPENVRNYPRPPALEAVPQRVRGILGGAPAFDTARALRVLETHHAPTYYVPREDVSAELIAVAGRSICEWKGQARYWDARAGGRTARRAAWSYERPTARFAALAGHLAFYAGTLDEAWVGGMRARAQPGDFYGGWVTGNLSGIVKGGPGTEGW